LDADILIRNGIVVTIDDDRRVLEDGAVAIIGDRIAAIGTTDELSAWTAGKIIDASRKLVLPGLVDAHAHAGHGLLKTLGAGEWDEWQKACEIIYTTGSDVQFWGAEARLQALERLRFGVTTGMALLGGGDSILRSDAPDYVDAHCEAVLEVGTRSFVAIGPTRPPHPRRYVEWNGGTPTERMITYEDQMAVCRKALDTWHGRHDGRIRIALITPTTRTEHMEGYAPELLRQVFTQMKEVVALSRERETLFTQDGHDRGRVQIFHDHVGMLGPNVLLSHCTDLTEQEMALLRDHGTHVAHNPSAVNSIRGRCPAIELLDMGVNVVIGSDATSPDRSGDMFRHMQQCMHYHRRHFRDPRILSPGKALEMCTIDAARALGLDHEIGSLEVGKKADVILLDLARPHMYPYNMPLYRAVYYANGNDVSTVIIDGKVRMEDRKVLSVDEEYVLSEAQTATENMLDRTGLRWMTQTPDTFWRATRF
jgi:5-methylthioadenosine/S-adenosylhomocysteine deaminase